MNEIHCLPSTECEEDPSRPNDSAVDISVGATLLTVIRDTRVINKIIQITKQKLNIFYNMYEINCEKGNNCKVEAKVG